MSLSCIVCYEYIKENDAAALLCGHIFDRQCIHEWMKNSRECPICRQAVPENVSDHIIHLYNANDEQYKIENILEEMRSELSKRRSDELNELRSKNLQLLLEKNNFDKSIHFYKERNSKLTKEYNELHQEFANLCDEYNILKEEVSRLFSALETSSKLQKTLQKSNEETFKNLDLMQKQLLNEVKSLNKRVSKMIQLQEKYVSDSLDSTILKIRSCCFSICVIINAKLMYETRNSLGLSFVLLVSLNIILISILQYLYYVQ